MMKPHLEVTVTEDRPTGPERRRRQPRWHSVGSRVLPATMSVFVPAMEEFSNTMGPSVEMDRSPLVK